MSLDINQRSRIILEAVIQDYIQNAEPVGSRTLQKKYSLKISPATIRNVMADLEDQGLLTQPHASAGRVPTDLGLRYYVDTILEVSTLPSHEQEAIHNEFAGMTPEVQQLIRRTSKVLSSVCKHIGVVTTPKFSRLTMKQIQFVRMSPRWILVVLVGQSGSIQNRIIELEEDMDSETLDRFNRYLNDILEGLTIKDIKRKIVDEMHKEKIQFDKMLSQALELSRRVFDDNTIQEDVFIEGRINLLDYPEFSHVEAMKSIFRTFEDKSVLVQLLDKTLNASGVQIFIGSEAEVAEMTGYTLIASSYTRGSRPLGTLGVIGPTRLNYSQIIPVVDYTAKLVSHILENTL